MPTALRQWLTPAIIAVFLAATTGSSADETTRSKDRGIFEDLNHRVTFSLPGHLDENELALFESGAGDRDDDGVPDQTDILLGALKAAANGAEYDASYHRIPFPGGDVPRSTGCCSDVIIRALRNAGIDLQAVLQGDITRRPKAYPHVKKTNHSIDHRRVKNLVIYMKRHMKKLDPSVVSPQGWVPGDIVLFDTLPKAGPDHIGIVSWELDEDGLPLVINNWTVGSTTAPMDLLSWCPVTHHFRVK